MFTFIGLSRVEFPNKDTGELITGWRFWVAEPAEAPSVGMIPVPKWFKEEEYEQYIVPLGGAAGIAKYAGKEVQLIVSLKGKIKGISFPQK
ncbi:MAG: hypothetical protein HFF11_01145 [Angelakisella sp.]|jgi:hypothetical protein|nr:hypothetical protein [Angelakisella sp.]